MTSHARRQRLAFGVLLVIHATVPLFAYDCVIQLYGSNAADILGFVAGAGVSSGWLSAALDSWSDCSGAGFPLLQSGMGDYTFDISYAQGQNTNGTGCAWFDHNPQWTGSEWIVVGGTIRMFSHDRWGGSCSGREAETLAHEIGHVLGLADSTCDNHIMGGGENVQPGECELTDELWQTLGDVQCSSTCWTTCSGGGCPEEPPQCETSPILIDLNDDGLDLAGRDDAVSFDIDADGTADKISWTASGTDDAFLVMDRNGNAVVDDGSELFGTATQLRSGERAEHGYEALREFDAFSEGGNGDGRLDSADRIWSRLVLWIDHDHDGISAPRELRRVATSRLTSIDLSYKEAQRRDRHGNKFRYRSTADVRERNGKTRAVQTFDVFFVEAR